MRLLFVLVASTIVCAAPALAQNDNDDRDGALGTEQQLDPDESPAIIEDYPSDDRRNDTELRSEREDLVQIPGAWASEEGVCASAEGSEDGLYLTDTVIRWQGTTCSIRNIDVADDSARIYAQCTGQDGRTRREFGLEVRDDETLSVIPPFQTEQQVIDLVRCPESQ